MSIVASWILLFCSISATDFMLELSAGDNWNLGSDGFVNFDDPNDSISFDTINNNDDEENLFANTAVHGPCHAAAAADAMNELPATLETRDSSCSTDRKKSSSPAPLLSPESSQLFQDPNQVLNDLFLPSSSSNSPSEPLDPPLYPGYLTPEQARDRTDKDRIWDLDAMGLSERDFNFVCPSPLYKVPVVCDGPFDATFSLGRCDLGKIEIFF